MYLRGKIVRFLFVWKAIFLQFMVESVKDESLRQKVIFMNEMKWREYNYFLQRTKSLTDGAMNWCPPFFSRVEMGTWYYYIAIISGFRWRYYILKNLDLHNELCNCYKNVFSLGILTLDLTQTDRGKTIIFIFIFFITI